MTTCTHCGFDITGKKFCPECGTAAPTPLAAPAMASCPACGGSVRVGAAFCMHCGKSLGAQAVAAVAAPITVAVSQPARRLCPACNQEVPAGSAFCTNCGQSMQASAPAPVMAAAGQAFCNSCGARNNPGSRFCNSCGQALAATGGTPAYPRTGPYQQPTQYPQAQYPQQQQYAQPQYQQYPQQAPMLGQQPLALRCPVCMAMAPQGTPACPSCHTSLAGVVPVPAVLPQQGQQQGGGLGGLLQGSGGALAAGALGGAVAGIGGEMLLHNLEHRRERDYDDDDYERRRHRHDSGGLLGDLGGLGKDIGLF